MLGGRVDGAAVDKMGVLRSTDDGETWECSTLSSEYGTTFTIAVDPADPEIIYAGGHYNNTGYKAGLFKTTNGGTGWTDIAGSLDGIVYALAFDPFDSSRLFAASSYGLWESVNGGDSWERRFSYTVYAMIVDPHAAGTIYLGTYDGVQVSIDGGGTWNFMNSGLPHIPVRLLHLDKTSRILYAGTEGESAYRYQLAAASDVDPADRTVPEVLALDQNYPNPFNAQTDICFRLTAAAEVTLTLYDITGRRVRTLLYAEKPPGRYTVTWDGRSNENMDLPSGIYMYKLEADRQTVSKKMILSR